MRPDDLLHEFDIDPAPIWPAEDGRLEPIFLAESFDDDFAEFAWLEDALTAEPTATPPPLELDYYDDGQPDDTPSAPPERSSPLGCLGSLGVHLLTLLVLLTWSSTPAELTGTIPVQLVTEASPSAEAAQPSPSVPDSTAPPDTTGKAVASAAPPAAAPPKTSSPAPPAPPAKPDPPPASASKTAAAIPPPKPDTTAAAATAAQPVSAADPGSPEPPKPGADTPRGDYLNYLVTLTRGHFDILPLAFLAGRRGRAVLSVTVLEDGTISRITVKRSSGYPDIDSKIEQMVAAVGRFPPVPENFRKPSVELDFNLAFPDALQQ